MRGLIGILVAALAVLISWPAFAALDLARVAITKLDNGLTLLVLEEHSRPIVSVQMLYKAGGRDDPAGRMGLAHFFEHMAFRGSKNFPGIGLVDEIYDVGGEWHGYTWIDQTTYFATAPAEHLDLLLRIEADRMGRLKIDAKDVAAEAGAVLTEMNSYENDPSASLFDAVLAAAFPVHPYGKNTIGYEGDVAAVTKADLDEFYAKNIRPGTAVLAVAGDVDRADIAKRVKALFGKFKGAEPPVLPAPAEPEGAALRRVRIGADITGKMFKIAYPAPAASSEDFAAFLVLQELAGGGSGVSFHQNDWGTPARADTAIGKAAENVTTWFIATAQPYVFIVAGEAGAAADENRVESSVHNALAAFAAKPVSEAELSKARNAVKRALVLDVETTEDAAHEIAYFEGVGALEQRLALPSHVDAVTAEQVQEVATRWLDPERRTIGWAVPKTGAMSTAPETPRMLAEAAKRAGAGATHEPAPAASASKLANGTPLIVQVSKASPTVMVQAIAAGAYECGACAAHVPAPGYTTIAASGLAEDFAALLADVNNELASAAPAAASTPSEDPETRLEEILSARFVSADAPAKAVPALVIAAGDVDEDDASRLLNEAFGSAPESRAPDVSLTPSQGDIDAPIAPAKSQGALGYMVAAPALSGDDAMAWRLALYVLTHHYGGRLGNEAISNRGLVYYIGSEYRSAGDNGLITLSIGVDPAKHDAMTAALKSELERLLTEPPTEAELAAAKRHFLGRRVSAAQSNGELAAQIAAEWAHFGRLLTDEEFANSVNAVTLTDLRAILPTFTKGDIVSVRVGAAAQGPLKENAQ